MAWNLIKIDEPVTGNKVTNDYLQELSKQLNKDIFVIDKVSIDKNEVNVEGTSYITKDGQVIYFNVGDFELGENIIIEGLNFYDSDGNSLNDLFYNKFLGVALGLGFNSTFLGFYIKYGQQPIEEPLLMSTKNNANLTLLRDSHCLVNVEILYYVNIEK